ncbi:hypothetical protein A3K73_02265 [Candidatus Pacearchaeota archaeon RBG_13_36_9]|nr:MAG: hypothetical protein A3K73_02265 [Candidatus Pacearchaeota archaeon RBG_13_36_9]
MEVKLVGLILCFLLYLSAASALTINSVLTNPSQIAPGEVSTIELGLENNGEEKVTDVSVSLNLASVPFAPELSSSEFNLDEIKDGRVKYATFKIRALNDAQAGIYKIPVQMSYKEGEEVKTASSLIGLTVNSPPILDVGIEGGLLLKGSENQISVKMINKGLSNVKFLEAELKRASYYSITSPEKVYIGGLDSDDFDSAQFKVYFKENAPSTINMPITLRYMDVLNKEHEETFSLDARVYGQEQAIQLGLIKRNNTYIYVIVVIVLITIYIVYRRIRKAIKRRKEKEE